MTIQSGLRTGMSLLLCSFIVGCANAPLLDTSRMTALQIRALQSRTYENQDAKTTLKTLLNVLQDEGYLVDYGNTELGLLHGTREVDELALQRFGEAPVALGHSDYQTTFPVPYGPTVNIVRLEATANVSDFSNQVKVRVNFQQKVANNLQGTVVAMPVTDPKYYQEFFAKLERGLFIQKQGL